MSKQEFIAAVAPVAVELRRAGSPIFPSVRIAQALLETGGTIHAWNNLVGFKVGGGTPNAYWKGRSVSTKTWEVYNGVRTDNVVANWRAYDTIADCFKDQDLLFNWSRYDRVRAARSPQEQAEALYKCGYATDPAYAGKLVGIIASYELTQYDQLEDDEMNKPLQYEDWQWEMIYQVVGKAYNEGFIKWDWAQKVKDRTLTGAELLFVNTVLDGRIDRKIEV